MIRIGQQFPHYRVPAFVKGSLAYFDFSACRGRWIACCCVPSLELAEITFLDRQTHTFEQEGALLLAVSPNAKTFHAPWFGRTPPLALTVLADSLKRLHRSADIPVSSDHLRCQSFLIDPEGILRFHLVHALNGRGMSASQGDAHLKPRSRDTAPRRDEYTLNQRSDSDMHQVKLPALPRGASLNKNAELSVALSPPSLKLRRALLAFIPALPSGAFWRRRVIRSDGRTALNVCACDKLHFTYGPITLHFEPNEFFAFAGDIAHLIAEFSLIQDDRQSVSASRNNDVVCH